MVKEYKIHKFKMLHGDFPETVCGVVWRDDDDYDRIKKRWDKVSCKNCLRMKK